MTFQITGLAAPTTYASVPVTTAAESQIDGELDIYMFDASTGVLVREYTTNSGDCSAYTNGKVTISNLIEYQGQTMNFYIVANPSSVDTTYTVGTTTEADFVETTTKELTLTSDKISEVLTTPLLLTGKTATTVQLTAAATASINLKRAVARFDVVNPFENFIIDEIYVSDARQQGYVFPQHVGALPTYLFSMDPVTGPATYEDIASERIARSVFYTYPTTMTETSITIKAHFEADPSASEYFTVNSTADIVANSRYKIVVSEDTLNGGDEENPLRSVTLSLVVLEWDEAEELPLEYGKGASATLSDFEASTPANWTAASKEYDFTDNLGGTLTFTATSAFGTAYDIVFTENERTNLAQDIVVDKISTQTYGFSTVDEYTVTIPKYSELGGGLYNISLEIYPVNNPTAKQVVTLWNNIAINEANFPDAKFRLYLEGMGMESVLTRADIATITILDLQHMFISSIKGFGYFTELSDALIVMLENTESVVIPYLPKLAALCIGSNDGVLTSVDVSQIRNSIMLMQFEINSDVTFAESIDNYPNLEMLALNISSYAQPFHVCNNPKLTYLDINNSKTRRLFSDLHISRNPNLDYLSLCFLEGDMLDMSESPKLRTLYLYDLSVGTIDASTCLLDNGFCLQNCGNIIVKVPANFPVEEYESGQNSHQIIDTNVTFVK